MRRFLLLALLAAGSAAADAKTGIVAGKHNLSVSGPGGVRSQSETEICVFCHVPHGGKGRGDNRPDPGTIRPYQPSTAGGASRPLAAPGGASRSCMSCHDGTIAIGQTIVSRRGPGALKMLNLPAGGRLPPGPANLGTDLSGSHPVTTRLVPGQKMRRPRGDDVVRLDAAGEVQCTSCHDPHVEDLDPAERKFLVKGTRGSSLCKSCHAAPAWQVAPPSHETSAAAFPRQPASFSSQISLREAGCAACHQQHRAQGRLLRTDVGSGDDRLCLSCHDGRVARLDVGRDANKPFAHAAPSAGPSGHDADEGPTNLQHSLPETRSSLPRHVTCVDCHNPHAASQVAADAPRARGTLAGVWGIDRNGLRVEPVAFEYEICFKCHADSANQPQARGPTPPETVRRAVAEVNLRRVFDLGSPSFHPVEGPGRNPDVPSLIAPLTAGSTIYCSDCHGSDAADSARGPHGSIHPHLLKAPYATADRSVEGPSTYGLCYRCHDREVVLSARSSFASHRRHVVDQGTPCSACHGAHGVSALAGNPVNNAHLVDFDLSIVKPNPRGLARYTSRGPRSGSCSLTCHGVNHDDRSY